MNRLRNRLILAFVGVALLAMIPLALVPYYTLRVKQHTNLSERIHETQKQIETDINLLTGKLSVEYLQPGARIMMEYIQNRPAWLDAFTEGTNPEIISLINSYFAPREIKRRSDSFLDDNLLNSMQFFPKVEFTQMEGWMDENLLYEENNKIYIWASYPLIKGQTRDEMEEIGGVFLKLVFIEKDPDNPSAPCKFRFPYLYNPHPIVLPANPSLFEDSIPKEAFEALFDFDMDGLYEEVEVNSVVIPSIREKDPIHALLKPILNHRRELTAVMVLASRVVSVWDLVGPSTAISFLIIMVVIVVAAVLVARSLSLPIYSLASAARQMAQGDLNTRVDVLGTEELRVLSQAFNQLASQIKTQVDQLQDKTAELEGANRELNQTHRFLQNILSNINTGVLSVDREERISHLNQFGLTFFGITDFEHRPLAEVMDCPPLLNLIRYSLEQGLSVIQEEIQFARNQEWLQLQVSTVPLLEEGNLIGLVVTFHDLSAIRQLEEQVRRQDRLAALGRMAAGVAHEIRNPLGIIRGSAEILQKRAGDQTTEKELAQFIVEEVNRLSRVVTDFLTFARPPEPSVSAVEVGDLLDTVASYTENQEEWILYPLQTEIEDDLPPIAVDEKLCMQVFLNLLLNARDAMPDGGLITIRATRRSQSQVAIEVIDSGIGIHPEQLDRIFDPFYTSKETGTGLGLSLVHQIMASHKGRIEADSTPGEGSIFRLIFPIAPPGSDP
ncbi:MAG: ATP-binding protein [bacterium]|jgi:signal transduction histidine kinase|nr:ATP-binding protein [bacterium]